MLNKFIAKINFNEKHREMLYLTISDYVSSGLGVNQYIYKSKKRYENDKDVLTPIYKEIYENMSSGASLSKSFDGLVPQDELAIIASTDKASDKAIVDIFKNLSLLVEKKGRILKSIFNFDLYLTLIICAFTPVVLFLMSRMIGGRIESISNMININRLPGIMQFVYDSYIPFLTNSFYLIWIFLIILVMIFWIAVLYFPNNSVRAVLDKTPIYIISIPFFVYSTYKSFVFLVTAGVYNRSGFDISTYVRDMDRNSMPYEKSIYTEITNRLDSGSYTAGEAISIGWLPKEIEYRLEDYSASSEFGFVIEKITNQMIDRICSQLSTLIKIVSWISLVVFMGSFGLLIGLLYTLSSSI